MKNLCASYIATPFLACTLFFASCTKDPAVEITPANTTPTLLNANGFLAFADQSTFQAYVENLHRNPADPSILQDIQFFESQSTELHNSTR